MSDAKLYPVSAEAAAHAWINNDQYLEMYKRSIDDPEGFWAEQATEFLTWFKPWDKVLDWDFTAITVSTAIWINVAIRSPLSGKATAPTKTRSSPISNCTRKFASSPTS